MLWVFSALAMAQAPSGKWTGNAVPNVGTTSKCNPNMGYELVVDKGKLKGKLDFGTRVQEIEATVLDDGKFETSFINPFGHPVNITGKLGDSFSVINPKHCGWGNIPLKR
jgi:hypothetical protein